MGNRQLDQGSNESVATTRHGFDVAGIVGGIAQRAPELIDCRIEAMLEIDEGRFSPYFVTHLLAGNYLARVCQQYQQDLEGLA
jgi:hypothetical protein